MTVVEMSRAMPSQAKILLAKETLKTLAEAVREAKSIPSGYLYAEVMDQMTPDVFEVFVVGMVNSGLVEKKHDLLIWKGE